jgi:hypothetical protein
MAPFPGGDVEGINRRQGADGNITDRRLVQSNSERGVAMEDSPNASEPGVSVLDDV